MTKKKNQLDEGAAGAGRPTEVDLTQQAKGVGRREFLTSSAAAGVGAAAIVGSSGAQAQAQTTPDSDADGGTTDGPSASHGIRWDYEADVVVVGSGGTGLPAAIRARDLGASVIVVEQNFDIGGRMAHSNAYLSLGGGDAIQERDRKGESDPDGFITSPPIEPPEALDDNPDLLFRDLTDWSVVNNAAKSRYRQNDPELIRSWADNTVAVRQFLMDNYVRFSRIFGTHTGGGLSRARRAQPMFNLGDVTDMRAGTVTAEDAGQNELVSNFTMRMMDGARTLTRGGPNTRMMGVAISRPLEFSAKEKGVQFMLNRRMDEIIREEPFSGRILGIKTTYFPRRHPDTDETLPSYADTVGGEWANGVISEEAETVYIRARKAVIVGAGGHHGNPNFRSMFYPASLEPSHVTNGWAWLGGPGRANDASGIIAGMRVGANLAGMEQNRDNSSSRRLGSVLATTDRTGGEFPGNPAFLYRRSVGIGVGRSGFEHLIAVNQVGKRFTGEMGMFFDGGGEAMYPQNKAVYPWDEYEPGNWRNAQTEAVRENYEDTHAFAAALQINEGSQPPHYLPGPIWAIFDQAAVDRTGWNIGYPYTGDNGLFFKADTLEELAAAVLEGNEHQNVEMSYLAETVARWNDAVASGVDEDFDRHVGGVPMHPLSEGPFYAARITVEYHDSCGGLRINGKGQVVDMDLEPIPGLYSGGESAGGFEMHGLGRACTQGYIAATHAAQEPS